MNLNKKSCPKIINYLMRHKLDIATLLTTVVGIVVYCVGFYRYHEGKTLEQILSLTVNYVTICSCAIVLIQLVAFVKDSRYKENRCRKEAALELARHYAENILTDMTFIQNVLSRHFNKADETEYGKIVNSLVITDFTKDKLDKNLKPITDIFQKGSNAISYDLLIEQANIFQRMDICNIENIVPEHQLEILNRRFKKEICDTMNILEYFAMSVNQNVAESDMLYPSLHQTYLKFVRFMYPYICYNNDKKEDFYTNTIELYRSWEEKENGIIEYEERKEKEKVNESKKRSHSKPLQ